MIRDNGAAVAMCGPAGKTRSVIRRRERK
jgi:hypothetical protein